MLTLAAAGIQVDRRRAAGAARALDPSGPQRGRPRHRTPASARLASGKPAFGRSASRCGPRRDHRHRDGGRRRRRRRGPGETPGHRARADRPGDRSRRWARTRFSACSRGPGFSTRERSSELSGRGIGLDVGPPRGARSSAGRWPGVAAGPLTRFTLTVPVSMVTTRVLFVRADATHASRCRSAESWARCAWRNEDLSRPRQQAVPEHRRQAGDRRTSLGALSSRAGDAWSDGRHRGREHRQRPRRRAGLTRSWAKRGRGAAARAAGAPRSRIVGTTLAESGAVVLVLAPRGSAAAGRTRRRRNSEAPHPRRTILVVDDSITTRTLERHILERAGYSVRLANDGQEALGVMRANRFDLVVADVDMPKLDGISMVRAMRSENELESLPVILVTSRDDERDRQRGLGAGAQAYIVKGRFDRHLLLETALACSEETASSTVSVVVAATPAGIAKRSGSGLDASGEISVVCETTSVDSAARAMAAHPTRAVLAIADDADARTRRVAHAGGPRPRGRDGPDRGGRDGGAGGWSRRRSADGNSNAAACRVAQADAQVTV